MLYSLIILQSNWSIWQDSKKRAYKLICLDNETISLDGDISPYSLDWHVKIHISE